MHVLEALATKPFAVIGHRGAAGVKPENTLASIEYALKNGADIVEVDVRSTRDGKLILLHDESFERLAGLPLKARDLDYKWIRENIRLDGEPIPTLEEALDLVRGEKCLFIEIKEPDTIARVLNLVEAYGARNWVAFISFYEEPLIYARRREYVTGLIYFRPPGKIVEAKRIGATIVLPYHRLATQKAIAFAHKLGLRVVAWTVNDGDTALTLVDYGVDGIATDYPDRLAGLRKTQRI